MNVEEAANHIERFLLRRGVVLQDPADVVKQIEESANELLALKQWDWSVVHLHPAFKTSTGKRDYSLPRDFPFNFLKGGQTDGSGYQIYLSDGNSEKELDYLDPAQYFSEDFEAAQNGKPNSYTIIHSDPGLKPYIWLAPPPDNNAGSHYTGRGSYSIAELKLESHADRIPALAGRFIQYDVLSGYLPQDPTVLERKERARVGLFTQSNPQDPRLAPAVGELPGISGWTSHID